LSKSRGRIIAENTSCVFEMFIDMLFYQITEKESILDVNIYIFYELKEKQSMLIK
jgi:hypothetical protein